MKSKTTTPSGKITETGPSSKYEATVAITQLMMRAGEPRRYAKDWYAERNAMASKNPVRQE